MNKEAVRCGGVVAQVIAAEVARTRCQGLVLASPPGPEGELLAQWLPASLPLHRPDPGAVADLAGALAAAGAPGRHVEALAWRAVADALALSRTLLPVAATTKTLLLLEDAPLAARVLPLGDVWSTDVEAWTGHESTRPWVLRNATGREVADVEHALRAYLEEGLSPDAAFAALDSDALGAEVRGALDAAEVRRRGLLVPKLHAWTVGVDLAR